MEPARRPLRRFVTRRALSAMMGVLVLVSVVGGLMYAGARANRRGNDTDFIPRFAPGAQRQLGSDTAPWPVWGNTATRDRFASIAGMRPPFSQAWEYRAKSLIEAPPVVDTSQVYLGVSDGSIVALDRNTGKRVWRTRTPGPIAASPAISGDRLYVAEMDGTLYVLNTVTGTIEWSFRTGSRLESSPIVIGKRVLFGAHNGTLYCLNTQKHRVSWTYNANAPIKAGVAIWGDYAYVGSYDGRMHAVRLVDGSRLWSTQTRRDFSFGGSLFSTPAIAYGRVYVGSTDGRVYSLGARTGKINWYHTTGDWVYGSPAIAAGRVFVGSYDGWFYSFDARTGDQKWKFHADDRISGSATVINRNVYFSSMGGTTYGLRLRDGTSIWTFPDGRYSPVVADKTQFYVTGRFRQYALLPPPLVSPPSSDRLSPSQQVTANS